MIFCPPLSENYTTAMKFCVGNLPDKTFENLLMNTKQIITFITKSCFKNINKHNNYYVFEYNFSN